MLHEIKILSGQILDNQQFFDPLQFEICNIF